MVSRSRCFDMATAKRLLAGSSPSIDGAIKEGAWVGLEDYSTYDLGALEHFTAHMKEVEALELGFRILCPAGALALAQLPQGFLFIPHLWRLDEATAAILGEQSFRRERIRCFGIEEPLTPAAAFAVAGGLSPLPEGTCDSPLHLSLPSISEEVARALRVHAHELYLSISEETLAPSAAGALAHHAGYFLMLFVANELPADAIVALRSNPSKRVTCRPITQTEIAYTVSQDLGEWLAAMNPSREVRA